MRDRDDIYLALIKANLDREAFATTTISSNGTKITWGAKQALVREYAEKHFKSDYDSWLEDDNIERMKSFKLS